jgi:hypothetical protein
VSTDVNLYYKRTHHALVDQVLGFDLIQSPYEENVGEVRNTGIEAALSVSIVQSRAFAWSLSVNGAINHNKLLSIEPGFQEQIGQQGETRNVAGYPLYGLWGQRETYVDRNHDGILEANEVTLDTAYSYAGSSIPTQTLALSTHVGVLGGAIALGASFDYSGGYRVFNADAQNPAGDLYLREQNVPGAPLWLQARAVAYSKYGPGTTPSGFLEDGSFVRFRELSVTFALPQRWAKTVRVENLSLTAAVRNLALWTRFTGPDPEVTGPGLGSGSVGNNDARAINFQAVPLARELFVRLNLGL